MGHVGRAGRLRRGGPPPRPFPEPAPKLPAGTPVGAGEPAKQLQQLQRLLAFLREPTYGAPLRTASPYVHSEGADEATAEAEGERAFSRAVAKPAAADARRRAAAREVLVRTLKPLMVRHTKVCRLRADAEPTPPAAPAGTRGGMLLARTQLLHALVAVFGSPHLPRCRPRDYPRLPEITRDYPRLPESSRARTRRRTSRCPRR